jgi:hypothetical protein
MTMKCCINWKANKEDNWRAAVTTIYQDYRIGEYNWGLMLRGRTRSTDNQENSGTISLFIQQHLMEGGTSLEYAHKIMLPVLELATNSHTLSHTIIFLASAKLTITSPAPHHFFIQQPCHIPNICSFLFVMF